MVSAAPALTPRSADGLEALIVTVINFILKFGIALTVLFILIGGVQYITAGGNDDKTGVAKKTLTYAIIGFIIVITALTIVNFVGSTLKNELSK